MSEKAASTGPNWALLLLVPAVVIVAKAAMHRRAMWESGWGPSATAGRRYGRHGRFGGAEGSEADARDFRLPPKIEWMLDTWHTRAHRTQGSAAATDDLPDPGDTVTA
jgi:hypothetical protein